MNLENLGWNRRSGETRAAIGEEMRVASLPLGKGRQVPCPSASGWMSFNLVARAYFLFLS